MMSLTGGPESAPASEQELEDYLSRPTEGTIASLAALRGDLLVLGAGGKLGFSLCRLARRSLDGAGKTSTRVIALSRFGRPESTDGFDAAGIETIAADLMSEGTLEALPEVANVLY